MRKIQKSSTKQKLPRAESNQEGQTGGEGGAKLASI